MNSPAENDGEQQITDALAPFGWTCSDEFWKRYYSDAWVFNLANAVVALSARVAVVRPTRDQIAECIARSLHYDEVFEQGDPERVIAQYLPTADAVLALFGVAVSDSQPVRPTRDHAIATLLETEVWPLEWSYEECHARAERFADALIREGGVAVSDSQETQ